jgi:hypothetical protein
MDLQEMLCGPNLLIVDYLCTANETFDIFLLCVSSLFSSTLGSI